MAVIRKTKLITAALFAVAVLVLVAQLVSAQRVPIDPEREYIDNGDGTFDVFEQTDSGVLQRPATDRETRFISISEKEQAAVVELERLRSAIASKRGTQIDGDLADAVLFILERTE